MWITSVSGGTASVTKLRMSGNAVRSCCELLEVDERERGAELSGHGGLHLCCRDAAGALDDDRAQREDRRVHGDQHAAATTAASSPATDSQTMRRVRARRVNRRSSARSARFRVPRGALQVGSRSGVGAVSP